MPMAKITPVGEAGLYHVHFLDARDPGFGQPGGGVDPGFDRPIHHPGHPDHGLPSQPVHPGNRPPGSGLPPHVGNRPPGSGGGGIPDNSLPSTPPPHVPPGTTLVLVRDPAGVWHYATLPPGAPPPTPVPTPPIASGPPPTAGTPLPPTAAPKT